MQWNRTIFSLAVLFLLSAPVAARVVEKTVATVNGEIILLSEFEKRLKPIREGYEALMVGPDKEEKLRELEKEVINQMIEEKLLLQEAKEKKIRVSKKEIQDGITEVKGRFKNEDEFKKELENQSMSCLLYTSPSPRDLSTSRMPSSA